MKANVSNMNQNSETLISNRKEDHFFSQRSLIDPKTGREAICVRFYHAPRGSVMYCCVWVNPCDYNAPESSYGHGGGRAGGYGYCKASAAFDDAVRSMGIELNESVSGRGDAALESAMYAIAKANTGKRKFFMVRANG